MLKLPWATHLYGALAHDNAAVWGEAFQVPSCHMVTNDGKVLQGHVHVVAVDLALRMSPHEESPPIGRHLEDRCFIGQRL